jgi:hypothetical protein
MHICGPHVNFQDYWLSNYDCLLCKINAS